MVNDPIALSLEKRNLWRRAATRWSEVLLSGDLSNLEMDWVLSRKEYCLRKVKKVEPYSDSSGFHGNPNILVYEWFGLYRK